MAAKRFDRKEIEPLLDAQERLVRDVARTALAAERGIAQRSYSVYRQFRAKLDEYDALSVLVEERLASVQGDPDLADLRARQSAATARVLSTLVRASIRFFHVMQDGPLPLGAREILIAELRSIHVARRLLDDPANRIHLDERALGDLETAERIIAVVLERAPGLLDFTAQRQRGAD